MEESTENTCKYCENEVHMNFAEYLQCSVCNKNVHITCLKRESTPGGIYGDVFYTYTCQDCSPNGSEIFLREKMPWLQAILLSMHHLRNKSPGIANNGFFHWKTHLVSFLDKKWSVLFPKDLKRRKNWMGTVSGSLSHFSPCLFTSGAQILQASGWWRLTFPTLSPGFLLMLYQELTVKQKISLKSPADLEHFTKLISLYIPQTETEIVLSESNICKTTEDIDVVGGEFKNIQIKDEMIVNPLFEDDQLTDDKTQEEEPIIIYSDLNSGLSKEYEAKKCFYNIWGLNDRKISTKKFSTNICQMRNIEENALCEFISSNYKSERFIRSLRRKLKVRKLQRQNLIPYFNIDNKRKFPIANEVSENNKFRHYYNEEQLRYADSRYFQTKLIYAPINSLHYIISPYTGRMLKPFIRRDKNHSSLWLKLMHEMLQKVNPVLGQPTVSSLDYCYVRPMHVPIINMLCEQYFWPGIDMTETLQYPEFSCVALYKKIIVGFAFMVPDVNFNETYISFIFTKPEWRRSGIAKFMIYHLIQTCMGKDITLHVAIDNPAIFLYQKFGFKVEKVIYNFYDAYLRSDSNQSKHAFYLRLER